MGSDAGVLERFLFPESEKNVKAENQSPNLGTRPHLTLRRRAEALAPRSPRLRWVREVYVVVGAASCLRNHWNTEIDYVITVGS